MWPTTGAHVYLNPEQDFIVSFVQCSSNLNIVDTIYLFNLQRCESGGGWWESLHDVCDVIHELSSLILWHMRRPGNINMMISENIPECQMLLIIVTQAQASHLTWRRGEEIISKNRLYKGLD